MHGEGKAVAEVSYKIFCAYLLDFLSPLRTHCGQLINQFLLIIHEIVQTGGGVSPQ